MKRRTCDCWKFYHQVCDICQGIVRHVVKEGSRDHVISWNTKGRKCSVKKCEINQKDKAS